MQTHESSEILKILIEVKEDVTTLKVQQADLSRRLLGNGQPGIVDRLDSRLKTLELKDAEEKGEKASSRRWVAYISVLVSSAITLLLNWLHRK